MSGHSPAQRSRSHRFWPHLLQRKSQREEALRHTRRAGRGSDPRRAPTRPRWHRAAGPHGPAQSPARRHRSRSAAATDAHDRRTIALLTSDRGAASRACRSDGNGTTVARPIITTSWRSRRMVRSSGPVSGPDDRCAARSRSASAPVAFRLDQRCADAVLDAMQGVVVATARQARQQFGKGRRDQFQQPRRVDADLADAPATAAPGRRPASPVNAPTVTSHNAIDRGIQRIGMAAWSEPAARSRR